MIPIVAPYIPLDLDTVEKKFVFNYFTLKSALYKNPTSNNYPHFFSESEANYTAPIMYDKIVQTPTNGMRLIITISIPLNPVYGFNANGIWNYVLPLAPDMVIP